ncbi:Shedu immune nuclease family protein [Aeromonas enteropelogenes]|uniref:Shedu immune nuclease family protein n=1 Tax=Aeromonas enteropelogenes TaxID=29489 RepID=UPI003F7498F5
MKILDVIHNFGSNRVSDVSGICRVRSYLGNNGVVVLLTDLGGLNYGQSVTNAVEKIIKSVIENGLVIQPVTFIEHYEKELHELDTFDIVTISPITHWTPITKEKVLELISCDDSEFFERSINNRRVYEKADEIRYKYDPFIGSVYIQSPEFIARKREIIDSMVSKSLINELILSGANEQELQRIIKQDLSIIAEAYVGDDEYICFSEYPLADGFVDFVIFSGRSRMDITLIEVKGANFNLVNSNNYRSFNHKVRDAAEQIQVRLGVVYRGYEDFRRKAHEKRKKVLEGKLIHNAFIGPHSCKQVDSNKDVNIRTIVIGGRTVNDLEESQKRHDYEINSTPPIRIESWDTWLRRLKR